VILVVLVEADLAIEVRDETLDVLATERAYVEATQDGKRVLAEPPRVVAARRRNAATDSFELVLAATSSNPRVN